MNELAEKIIHLESSASMSLVEVDVRGEIFSSIILETPQSVAYLKIGRTVGLLFKETEVLIIRVIFTFLGLVVGSVIYSLPFMVNPIKAGFQSLPVYLSEAAVILGKSRWGLFKKFCCPTSNQLY